MNFKNRHLQRRPRHFPKGCGRCKNGKSIFKKRNSSELLLGSFGQIIFDLLVYPFCFSPLQFIFLPLKGCF
ncbi:hypothetical protein CRYUN_Cryun10bG0085600 [Craigia yunnanensis]